MKRYTLLLLFILALASCTSTRTTQITSWKVTKLYSVISVGTASRMAQEDLELMALINSSTGVITLGNQHFFKYVKGSVIIERDNKNKIMSYTAIDFAGDSLILSVDVEKDKDGVLFLLLGAHYLDDLKGLTTYFKLYPTPYTIGRLKRGLIL